ncbi:hypothetical protein BGW42_008287, partial [Actinomortierella wolfii]
LRNMYKSILALAFLVSSAFAVGDYHIDVFNNAGQRQRFYEFKGYRTCLCIKNVQTAKIRNVDVGDVKLFSTTDCTGNYSKLGKGKTQGNTYWVYSVSFGDSGKPSVVADPTCPKYSNWQ